MTTTAERVLDALHPFDLKQETERRWRCNSPFRTNSDSLSFCLTIEPDGEHGAYYDHRSAEEGSLYELAQKLNVSLPERTTPVLTKRAYSGLADYAAAHGVPRVVFETAGWREQTYQQRPALSFPTDSGVKYRFIDGNKPTFKPQKTGYQASWYRLDEAVQLAQSSGQPLVICNGEPSTIVAQHFGVAATATTGGENKTITVALLETLAAAYNGPIIVALDCDPAGLAGSSKWYEALSEASYDVRVLNLDGGIGFDLADFCQLNKDGPADALQHLYELQQANEDDEITELLASSTIFVPPLPPNAAVDSELAANASPWLDDYITFSRRWSPESYDGFHEAIAIWILSTVAARRVVVDYGEEHFTNLYIALCARSTVYAKSTAAKIGRDVLNACGLDYLLAPDDATPQAFLKNLTLRVPDGYALFDDMRRAFVHRRLAHGAQKGWFYDEFGQKLHAMMQNAGAMVEYRGHLRRLDDYPPTYEYATVGRGTDLIDRPYLALLASLTPADLQPHARKGAALWGDGFLARFALVAPPPDLHIPCQDFPEGQRIIPREVLERLRHWHDRLGTPHVSIIERVNDKGEGTGMFDATADTLLPQRCIFGDGVRQAVDTYRRALRDVLGTMGTGNDDLDGNYGRMHIKALRIAMLLASLENEGRIEMGHWARAQQITERWRADLHYLVAQLGTHAPTKARTLEDRIVERLALDKHTVRTLVQSTHASHAEVEAALAILIRYKRVREIKTRRTAYYELVREDTHEVAVTTPATSATPATATPPMEHEAEGVADVARSTCSTDEESGDTLASAMSRSPPPDTVSPTMTTGVGSSIDVRYVQKLYATGDEKALQLHCALHRVSYIDALAIAGIAVN